MSDPALQRSLWMALAQGDSDRIQKLAESGADLNEPVGNGSGETPLIRAITDGNCELLKLLLRMGSDVNRPCPGAKRWTPLMFALSNPAMVRELLAAGADVNARTCGHSIKLPSGDFKNIPGGETALHLAVATGNAEAVRILAAAGAKVEATAENGCAPLDYAVRLGSVNQVVTNLVEAGAELTPARLDAMHSAAHRPDSDLAAFSLTSAEFDPGNDELGGSLNVTGQGEGALAAVSNGPGTQLKCPKCHSLIYSRKPKLCGHCGALLPAELLLSEEQAKALEDSRQWARKLADSFASQPVLARNAPTALPSASLLLESSSPENLLRSWAEEFRQRRRPDFWLYLVGCGGALFFVAFLFMKLGGAESSGVLLVMTAFYAGLSYRAWHRASPICPNCRANIRFCAAIFCHLCGKGLSLKTCAACGVDNSWSSFVRPYASLGNFRWIKYCPGCGVELDSKVPRWRFGERG